MTKLLIHFLLFGTFLFVNSVFAGNAFKIHFQNTKSSDYILEYELNNFTVEKTEKNGQKFSVINFEHQVKTEDKGIAEVPFVHSSIALPISGNYEVKVVSSNFKDYPLDYPLLPSRGVITRNQNPSEIPYEIDRSQIADKWYPGALVKGSDPYVLRDVRGMNVYFYPFQYNSLKNVLRVYNSITIEVVPVEGKSINPLKRTGKIISSMNGIYKSMFVNFDVDGRPTLVGELGDILVIHTSDYKAAIQPYIDWKKMKGFKVQTAEVSKGTNVKNLIKEKYNANKNILYVLLVGDWEDIKSDTGPSSAPMDPMLGAVEGNDFYADIIVGRFSAKNANDVTIQVNKTIAYERDIKSGPFMKTAIGIASNEGTNGQGDDGESDQAHMDLIRTERLIPYGYTTVHQDYQNNGATASQIATQLNQGVGLINYVGHGSMTSWGTTGFSNSNIASLSNGNMLPYIVSVACVNGAFHSGESFAEAWLKKSGGGAIATWMSTINQPWAPPMRGQDYFNDLLIGGYDYSTKPGNGTNITDKRTTFGSLTLNAANLMYAESSQSSDLDTIKTWTVFGDPSLTVRTKAPVTIEIGSKALFIGVPFKTNLSVAGAIVSLYQNGVSFVGVSDKNGDVTIPHELVGGNAIITISGQDLVTESFEVKVVPQDGAYISLTSYKIVDGNNNQAEYGETVGIDLDIKNLGTKVSKGLVAKLTTQSPLVQGIDVSGVDVGDLKGGDSIILEDAFKVTFVKKIEDQTVVPFVVEFSDESGRAVYKSKLNIRVNAPKFGLSYEVLNASTLNPGDTAQVKYVVINNGHALSEKFTLDLTETSNLDLEISGKVDVFSGLKPNESVSTIFKIKIPETVPTGSSASFEVKLSTGDVLTHSLVIGITETFESGKFNDFWSFDATPWEIDSSDKFEGTYSAKSGAIKDSGRSHMIMKVNFPADGKISFYRKTSCERNYDYLLFTMDGIVKHRVSGENDWEEIIIDIPAGRHTLKWSYEKDYMVSSGKDAVWVDRILLMGGSPE